MFLGSSIVGRETDLKQAASQHALGPNAPNAALACPALRLGKYRTSRTLDCPAGLNYGSGPDPTGKQRCEVSL